MTDLAWTPPSKPDEWLKYRLVPGPLYIRYLVAKALSRGEPELHLVPFLADPAKTSLDIGANKGVYSSVMARYSQHVVAFEPNPKLLDVLRRWAGAGGIDVRPLALSNASGSAVLRIPRGSKGYSNQGASLSAVKVSGDHGAVTVETARLDDLKLSNIGFIKIDVEGFEQEVLEGAKQTLAREKPSLLIEIEEGHTKRPIESDLAAVEALGYRGYYLRHRRVLTPLSSFDPETQHRHPTGRGDYVFNFIFLPR
jgi:FkbM family methyltransferase